ncbi:uncharacterized protein BCR38DRAFT_492023 [Pseudomassariella vexata]|uniref:C2H2-type domain-containing protein n=1 Tax=Pseudomassariella vexata TaxID=1141098 RepID=A0A1Y2EIF9_9PEZI|nr:uncharacterized protein BCR38DRAFT_492023 [Pseudomassariella vexata]ORY71094.1 hypothetical protein BCR38DRAFT_492023 [Pseudomassariella vexata]
MSDGQSTRSQWSAIAPSSYAPSEAPTEEGVEFQCPRCDENFRHIRLLKHHQQMNLHYKCDICNQDFADEDSIQLHKFQDHPKEQRLRCPGCGEAFNKAGGLMQHVENHICSVITPEMLHERRDMKYELPKALQTLKVDNDGEYAESTTRSAVNKTTGKAEKPTVDRPNNYRMHVRESNYLKPNESLQAYRMGNSKVSDLLTGEELLKPTKPPMTGTQGNVWGQTKDLFPNAPAKVIPTPEQLRRATASAPSAKTVTSGGRIIDPDASGFTAHVFFESILGKFKCPHGGCGAKFPKAQALVGHLKSPAHRPKALISCPICLKQFNTMSAAVQHAETSSVRCSIQESNEFRSFVHQVTGGLMDGDNSQKTLEKNGGVARFSVPTDFIEDLPMSKRYV